MKENKDLTFCLSEECCWITFNKDNYYYTKDCVGLYGYENKIIYRTKNNNICHLKIVDNKLQLIELNEREICIGFIDNGQLRITNEINLENLNMKEINFMNRSNRYVFFHALNRSGSWGWILLDLRTSETIVIDRLNRFYDCKFYDGILVFCKSFEESDYRIDNFYGKSFVAAFDIDILFSMNQKMTVEDIDKIIFEEKGKVKWLMIEDNIQWTYDIVGSNDNVLCVRNSDLSPKNHPYEFEFYIMPQKKQVYPIGDKSDFTDFDFFIKNNRILIISDDERTLFDSNLNKICSMDDGYSIYDIIGFVENDIYIISMSEQTYAVEKIDMVEKSKKVLYVGSYENYIEESHRLISYRDNNFLLVTEYGDAVCYKSFEL